ncbi:acyl-[acyl-carrier-protein] thioesterase [Anaerococcus tetradius]|uniref:acyl-[acyl-carrier-protein] thioesterase n=1 Tax=Anaerococcus tetradius TaxID=33036 RepID=UPI0023F45E8B|nr:acyl-ACP thioesterase domain-containing protein [Anaerococcus tetradius]
MKFKKKFKIGRMHVDPFNYISMRYLVALMNEVAFDQAEILEKDIDMKNLRWIIYSWDIQIENNIRLGEEIEISTIPTHMDKFYAYRDFIVESRGNILARAKATFLLMDITRLRPIKIPQNLSLAYGKENPIFDIYDMEIRNDLAFIKDIQLRRADLDNNFHINNAVYFDLIKETVDIYDKDISYIKLIYRNEIRDKKQVQAFARREDKAIDFALRGEDGRDYCLGKIKTNV